MITGSELLFATAGIPKSARAKSSVSGIERLKELGLDAMELEYVRGTFPGDETAKLISETADKCGIRLTAHGPYYINLNAQETEKLLASRERIIKTAYCASLSGAESITFHAGFFMGCDRDEVYRTIAGELAGLSETISDMGISIDIRPELTGKESQFGSLDEIFTVSKDIDSILPCIDWSHLHARNGDYNTAKEFQSVMDLMRKYLGDDAVKRCHMHISGIDYGPKGERKHLELDDSDMNYKDLLRVLKDNCAAGFLVCESPAQEDDARKLKDFYTSI